jgi:hypothetical protein
MSETYSIEIDVADSINLFVPIGLMIVLSVIGNVGVSLMVFFNTVFSIIRALVSSRISSMAMGDRTSIGVKSLFVLDLSIIKTSRMWMNLLAQKTFRACVSITLTSRTRLYLKIDIYSRMKTPIIGLLESSPWSVEESPLMWTEWLLNERISSIR